MSAPQHTRPFNLEHARAGAPYSCRDGTEATILKFDGRHPVYPLTGIAGPDDYMTCWTNAGKYEETPRDHKSDLVMTPLGYLDGKPVFVGDEIVNAFGHKVKMPAAPSGSFDGCRWPAPEREYPQATITVKDLAKVTPHNHHFDAEWSSDRYTSTLTYTIHGRCKTNLPLQAIANAALRHAIDAGQVIDAEVAQKSVQVLQTQLANATAGLNRALRALVRAGFSDHGGEEWKPPMFAGQAAAYDMPGIGQVYGSIAAIEYVEAQIGAPAISRAARDMAIAEAVKNAAYEAVMNCSDGLEGSVIRNLHLTTIIAGVQS